MTVDQLNTLGASGTNWNFSLNGITSAAAVSSIVFAQNGSELLATVTDSVFGSNGTMDESNYENPTKNVVYPQCVWSYDDFNCTEDQYLLHWRGPRTLPLSTALSVSLL